MGRRNTEISEKALRRHERIVQKLTLLTVSWGGELIRLSSESEFWEAEQIFGRKYEVSYSPFESELAVNYKKFQIFYVSPHLWPGIIHEMGHVFASALPPRSAEEYNFFGWEYALAKLVGWPEFWRESNADYGTTKGEDSYDFGTLSREEANALLLERVKFGRSLGILDGWTPLPLRRGPRAPNATLPPFS